MPISRDAVIPVVFVNGRADSRYKPLTIQQNINGSRLSFATLAVDFSDTQARFMDSRLLPAQGDEIEIVGNPNGQTVVYHWGTVSMMRASVHDEVDAYQIVSRVESFAFGSQIYGQIEVIPEVQRPTITPTSRPCIFNPYFSSGPSGGSNKHPRLAAFLDPRSTFTGRARRLHGGTHPVAWKLSDVVFYLLTFGATIGRSAFTVPPLRYFQGVIDDTSADITNLEIPDGTSVPEALSLVLAPFGYGWYVNFDAPGRRSIRIFRRGLVTRLSTLKLQRPGEIVESTLSNVAGIDLEIDVSSCINSVKGIGGQPKYEGTWLLVACWPVAQDNTPVAQMHVNHANFNTVRNVWRKWALNENGDYNGLRPTITKRFDFRRAGIPASAVGAIARRRRFLETLSTTSDGDAAGKVSGCRVEYWDGAKWRDVTVQCVISDVECAVYFSGEHAPEEIFKHGGNNSAVRVTASIEMDNPIVGYAPKRAASCLKHTNEAVLDLRTQYSFRERLKAGPNASSFIGAAGITATEHDDRTAIQVFCTHVRDTYDKATISGPIELEGLDWPQYKLGDGVAGIQGRNINLAASTFGPIYPQIIAITYNVQEQRTSLQLDEFVVERRFAQQLGAI